MTTDRKEEILITSVLSNFPEADADFFNSEDADDSKIKNAILQAMDLYAKEIADAQSVEFAKWVATSGHSKYYDGWSHMQDQDTKITDSQLLAKYHEHKKTNP